MTQLTIKIVETIAVAIPTIAALYAMFRTEPASKEIVAKVEALKVEQLARATAEDTYWRDLLANNAQRVTKDLNYVGIWPTAEAEARELYHIWCQKLDELEEAHAKHSAEQAAIEAENSKPLKATFSNPMHRADLSESMTKSNSIHMSVEFPLINELANYKGNVWVYNVSRQTFVVDHPVLGTVKIPGNTTRKRYSLYTRFPGVMILPKGSLDEHFIHPYPVDGRNFVMDLINPDNFTLDQDRKRTYTTGVGRNLSDMGVFWSLSNPPKKEEISAAVKRMAARYNILLERINELYLGSLPDMKRAKRLLAENYNVRKEIANRRFKGEDVEQIEELTLEEAYEQSRAWRFNGFLTPEHHFAADYYNLITPWHPYKGCGTQG